MILCKRFPQWCSMAQIEGNIAIVLLAIMAERIAWLRPSLNYCSVEKPSHQTGTGALDFGAQNLPRTPSKQGFCCHLLAVEGHAFHYTNDLDSALPPKSPKQIFRELEVSSGIMIIPSGPLVLQMRKFLFMIGFYNPKEYSVRDRHPESPGSQGCRAPQAECP